MVSKLLHSLDKSQALIKVQDAEIIHRNDVIKDLEGTLNVPHMNAFSRVEFIDEEQLHQSQDTVEAINFNSTDPKYMLSVINSLRELNSELYQWHLQLKQIIARQLSVLNNQSHQITRLSNMLPAPTSPVTAEEPCDIETDASDSDSAVLVYSINSKYFFLHTNLHKLQLFPPSIFPLEPSPFRRQSSTRSTPTNLKKRIESSLNEPTPIDKLVNLSLTELRHKAPSKTLNQQ